jgi:hypothetical protein
MIGSESVYTLESERVDEIKVSITQLVWKEEEMRKTKGAVSDRNTAVLIKKVWMGEKKGM